MEITIKEKENKNLEDVLRKEFLKAKIGDIIRVKFTNKPKYTYLFLSKINKKRGYDNTNKSKDYTVTNIESGYTWKIGSDSLDDSFDLWFINNRDVPKILTLDILSVEEMILSKKEN